MNFRSMTNFSVFMRSCYACQAAFRQRYNLREFQKAVYEMYEGVYLEVSVEVHENFAKRYFTILFCEHRQVPGKLSSLLYC